MIIINSIFSADNINLFCDTIINGDDLDTVWSFLDNYDLYDLYDL